MESVFERYDDIEVDGVTIDSWRGLKGDEEHGILEVISITGHKGDLTTGILYNPDKYTYKEAMDHWQRMNLPGFRDVA